ncbi:hypothetical protein AJ87_05870 [Rhizobium yanglingense]|nr:hypothetical protein AJ87_05870 [Rhizobium yanglingense]
MNSNKATADQQIATVTSAVNAAAAQTTALSATVDDRFAQGLVKFAAAASQSGVDARFSVMLRGSISGTFKESGMFLELYTQGGVQKSRFAVLADQFVVTDGSTTTLPMVFENGQLKLAIANIGTVTAGVISFGGGKVVINANGITVKSG